MTSTTTRGGNIRACLQPLAELPSVEDSKSCVIESNTPVRESFYCPRPQPCDRDQKSPISDVNPAMALWFFIFRDRTVTKCERNDGCRSGTDGAPIIDSARLYPMTKI
jgi:hypothetical protein